MCQNKFDNIKFVVDDFLIDITQSVCMLVKEGIDYRFTHRSFQEYFAAWYTCKLIDSEQSELLENWIKNSNAIKTDSYFTMLFNLQGEKVNKIILYPGIKKLRKKYLQTGFSLPFLKIFIFWCEYRKAETGRKMDISSIFENKKQLFM